VQQWRGLTAACHLSLEHCNTGRAAYEGLAIHAVHAASEELADHAASEDKLAVAGSADDES